jgi:hypothetical protein
MKRTAVALQSALATAQHGELDRHRELAADLGALFDEAAELHHSYKVVLSAAGDAQQIEGGPTRMGRRCASPLNQAQPLAARLARNPA